LVEGIEMEYDDDIVFSDEEVDFLIQIFKLPFLQRCKKVGIVGKEIKTPFGTLQIIEGIN